MTTTTVGFAVADKDRPLLDRLVARFGHGNRSEYLRETLRVMESIAITEELQELQDRNAGNLAAKGITSYEEAVAHFAKKKLMAGTPVVFDVNVLVTAVALGKTALRSWPAPPPVSANPAADCVGVINDAAEFALWLSPHILENTIRVLHDFADWSKEDAEAYARILMRLAEHSGGGTLVPPRTVHDCPDFEDNLILDLAAETAAFIVVSEDSDLTSMFPWKGTPILRPREFGSRVDAMRRHQRRRR